MKSATEYHKIQTLYKRDPKNKHKTLLEGEWSLPEFEYLAENKWEFTEKVDGTNIRVIYAKGVFEDQINFKGRTDRAQIPVPLMEALTNLFDPSKFNEIFKAGNVVLYGEGYGKGIQKVGKFYRQDNSFVLFDVMVNRTFLPRSAVEEIAQALEIEVVPVIGYGSLYDMVTMARAGITSKWGDFMAEGIVARPTIDLKARNGNRIITKIKCRDFIRE